MVSPILIVFSLVHLGLLFYAIAMERMDGGCSSGFSIYCKEELDVRLKGTYPSESDSSQKLLERMKQVISHSDRPVWRNCFMMATVLTFFVYIIMSLCGGLPANHESGIKMAVVFLTSLGMLYFYQNWFGFHVYDPLKKNGEAIIKILGERV